MIDALSAPRPGSSVYYALRFTRTHKDAVLPLWAFFNELEEIIAKATENHITQMKFQWWLEEVERTYNGGPQHPITQALWPVIQQASLPKADFIEHLNARLDDLSNPYFETVQQLNDFFARLKGSEHRLFAAILGPEVPQAPDFATELGIALSFIQHILQFGQNLTRGRIYFPHEDLQFFEMDPAALLQKKWTTADYAPFLLRQAMRAKEHYQKALACLAREDRYTFVAPLVIANIQLALLHEVEQENFNVLTHTYRLSALRKLWVAWRTHYRLKRNLPED